MVCVWGERGRREWTGKGVVGAWDAIYCVKGYGLSKTIKVGLSDGGRDDRLYIASQNEVNVECWWFDKNVHLSLWL